MSEIGRISDFCQLVPCSLEFSKFRNLHYIEFLKNPTKHVKTFSENLNEAKQNLKNQISSRNKFAEICPIKILFCIFFSKFLLRIFEVFTWKIIEINFFLPENSQIFSEQILLNSTYFFSSQSLTKTVKDYSNSSQMGNFQVKENINFIVWKP